MASLLAMDRATFPLSSFGAFCISGWAKRTPNFGGFPCPFMCLKRAFSAPRSWIVLAGIPESFLRPPASAINRAAIECPAMAEILGATLFISTLTYRIRVRKAMPYVLSAVRRLHVDRWRTFGKMDSEGRGHHPCSEIRNLTEMQA